MLIPREHGAWGMLYTPFLIALFVLGKFDLRVVLLFVVITAIFFAHEPILRLARNRNRKEAQNWLMIYLAIGLFAGAALMLIYRLWLLILFGIVSVSALWIHFQFIRRKSERSIFAELLGVVSLTSSAPALCYVVSGSLTTTAITLWVLCCLYFASSIFYLKSLISRFSKKGDPVRLFRDCICYHVVLIISVGLLIFVQRIPLLVALGFVPILIRTMWGLVVRTRRLNIRRIGFAEFGLTLLFLAIVTLSFH